MMAFKILALLPLILGQCFAANILAVLFFPGVSHFQMFKPVLKELARRGHSVDVYSSFPSDEKIKGYTDIVLESSAPKLTNNVTFQYLKNLQGTMSIINLSTTFGAKACDAVFKSTQMQYLKNSTKNYDLVITQLFSTECLLGWGWHFGAPNVVMTSSVNLPWSAYMFGNPDNPSYIPTYLAKSGVVMNLYERIVNTWDLVMSKLIYWWYSSLPSNQVAKEFFGQDMPDLDILARNISLQLINTHFSILGAIPLVPNIVEVAGLHIQQPKPVDKYFDGVLTTDKKGIIYFNTGTLIKSETFPIQTTQAIFDAFAQLPYKVIWKATKENFPNGLSFPENIHFEKWLPQQNILCDPRVKLFVSHGGMFGTQETVYCGVPILGIPYFADQFLNINQAEAAGFAKMLDFDNISKETVLEAAKELLDNPKYLQKSKEISHQFKDRPSSAMDTAIYWIEYVIRHKGAPQLQSPAKNLTWYQYYLLDVFIVAVGIPSILISLFVKLISKIVGSNGSRRHRNKKVKTK
ncbi:unnamed protein product [Ceutorhynchus assimilis]|uniref:UDP-glucuronosyltransferase n=1 Tax=Ceutorhynchus assimilis TaxID=467358 RepID=A0A9N9MPQ5_9CUCU|nr:unnamed protein product [Ceutorhynchus assimilis]